LANVFAKVIEVPSGSLSIDKSLSAFNISGGKIELGQYATIDVDPVMYFNHVKTTSLTPGVRYSGIWVYGQQSTPYLYNCMIEHADIGIRVYPAKGVRK
jgi:hypothetical protein